jgi:hypothetical protein
MRDGPPEAGDAFLLGKCFAREVHAHGLRLPHGGRSASVNIGACPEPRHGAVSVARVISADHSSTGRVVVKIVLVADAIFEEPRLAEIYDAIDGDRSDLNAYAALVDELGAHVVLDVGCGTGTFACMPTPGSARRTRPARPRVRLHRAAAPSRTRPGADEREVHNL